jgi:hypothetical protein
MDRGHVEIRLIFTCSVPKLLNARQFRASSGFPPVPKTRYNLGCGNRRERRLGKFPRHGFHAEHNVIGQAEFSAYMLQTHSMM